MPTAVATADVDCAAIRLVMNFSCVLIVIFSSSMQVVRAGRYFFGHLIALAINFKFLVIVGWVSIQFAGYAWLRIVYVGR